MTRSIAVVVAIAATSVAAWGMRRWVARAGINRLEFRRSRVPPVALEAWEAEGGALAPAYVRATPAQAPL